MGNMGVRDMGQGDTWKMDARREGKGEQLWEAAGMEKCGEAYVVLERGACCSCFHKDACLVLPYRFFFPLLLLLELEEALSENRAVELSLRSGLL